MLSFSTRAQLIKPSATLSFNAFAKKLKNQGKDITMFTAGQPDYDPPKILLEATKRAVDSEKHVYTAVLGDSTLRQRIADYLKKYKLDYTGEEIAVSSGVKLALANTLLCLIDSGDEVIHPAVTWGSYLDMVVMCGGKPIACPLDENLNPEVQVLEKLINSKTKAIILNSPSNPTGSVQSKKDLLAIARLAVKHNFFVISDEIYSETVYGKEHLSIASLEEEVHGIRELTCTINGASKSLAIPGWRLGYTAAPVAVIDKIDAIQGADASNAPSIVQFGLSETLKEEHKEDLEAYFQEKRGVLCSRRDFFIKGLQEITFNGQPAFDLKTPEGAFYLWVNIKTLKGDRFGHCSIEIRDHFLNEAGVAFTEGSAFGDDDYVRFSYAVDMLEIERGLEKLKKYLR